MRLSNISRAPWIVFKQLTECRRLNDHIEVSIPNCPLASAITKAINMDPTVDPDFKDDMKAMTKIIDWAREEGLSNSNRGVWICPKCLGVIYNESKESANLVVSVHSEVIPCVDKFRCRIVLVESPRLFVRMSIT